MLPKALLLNMSTKELQRYPYDAGVSEELQRRAEKANTIFEEELDYLIADAKDSSYEEGYDNGLDYGYEAGHDEGYEEGFRAGRREAKAEIKEILGAAIADIDEVVK